MRWTILILNLVAVVALQLLFYSARAHIASAAIILTGLVFFFSQAPRREESVA